MNAGSVWVSAGPPTWFVILFGVLFVVEAALIIRLIVLVVKDMNNQYLERDQEEE